MRRHVSLTRPEAHLCCWISKRKFADIRKQYGQTRFRFVRTYAIREFRARRRPSLRTKPNVRLCIAVGLLVPFGSSVSIRLRTKSIELRAPPVLGRSLDEERMEDVLFYFCHVKMWKRDENPIRSARRRGFRSRRYSFLVYTFNRKRIENVI